MRILLLDNYDSFTYNLVHLVEKCSDHTVDVFKNDAINLLQVEEYEKIILSPGPGLPSTAGIMPELLREFYHQRSILGVCLGLQAIGELFGCRLENLEQVVHGMATPITVLKQDGLFLNCPKKFNVGRYHSWVIDKKTVPSELEILAEDDCGHIMAARHKDLDICGVQFHPESILSEYGETIISNWLTASKK
jgi:anthranilate synthase component II